MVKINSAPGLASASLRNSLCSFSARQPPAAAAALASIPELQHRRTRAAVDSPYGSREMLWLIFHVSMSLRRCQALRTLQDQRTGICGPKSRGEKQEKADI
ncbi:hypothetical protein SRHO_G00139080 [Serrasalmus rhombeus]